MFNAVTGGGLTMKSDPKKAMEAYDRLPYEVRRVISEAKFTHSSLEAEDLIIRFRAPVEVVIDLIREKDDNIAAKTKRVWEYKADEQD